MEACFQFHTSEKCPVHALDRKLAGSQNWCRHCGENKPLALSGIEAGFVSDPSRGIGLTYDQYCTI
jgi:hypothetical protein